MANGMANRWQTDGPGCRWQTDGPVPGPEPLPVKTAMSDLSIPTSPTNQALPGPRGPGANGAEARGWVGELESDQVQTALQARGVNASLSSLVQNASLVAIARSIEWFDGQSDVGPGRLVEVIRGRKGGV